MGRKKKNQKSSDIHEELSGFDIHINEFGEIISSYTVDNLNTFLDDKVKDKKFKGRKKIERNVNDSKDKNDTIRKA